MSHVKREEPMLCQLCGRKALYRAHTFNGVEIGACAKHRSIATLAMVNLTAVQDARFNMKETRSNNNRFVERGYNVGRKS